MCGDKANMVTKPKPIWERWASTPKGKERIHQIYYILMISLNVFIVVGLILFFVFLIFGR